jgi:hypothetical protein
MYNKDERKIPILFHSNNAMINPPPVLATITLILLLPDEIQPWKNWNIIYI